MPKQNVPLLQGPRLRLRLLTEDDLPVTLAWRNQEHIRCWFLNAEPLTWDQHNGWFQRYRERNDDFVFIIEETAELHQAIGQLGIYRIDWQGRTAEFGRVLIGERRLLAAQHRLRRQNTISPRPVGEGRMKGRDGYAGEALATLFDFCFRTWGLRMIYSEILQNNSPSLRLGDELGYERMGVKDGMIHIELTPERFARSPYVRSRAAA